MTESEARELMQSATKNVDWVNLARVMTSVGDWELDWLKYDNAYYIPDYLRALQDSAWLTQNAAEVEKAFKVIKKSSLERKRQQ